MPLIPLDIPPGFVRNGTDLRPVGGVALTMQRNVILLYFMKT